MNATNQLEKTKMNATNQLEKTKMNATNQLEKTKMNATETAPKKTKRKQDTCYCDAYRFPHRLGGGKCENVDIDGPFCTSCGSSCEVVQGDDGIGPYEFWGQKGNDSQPYSASDCCDAEVVEHQHELDMVEVWG